MALCSLLAAVSIVNFDRPKWPEPHLCNDNAPHTETLQNEPTVQNPEVSLETGNLLHWVGHWRADLGRRRRQSHRVADGQAARPSFGCSRRPLVSRQPIEVQAWTEDVAIISFISRPPNGGHPV